MPNLYYRDIFAQRGSSYDRAMQFCPAARDSEFHLAIKYMAFTPGQTVLDVPAGGGYLQAYLPDEVNYRGLDFSGDFRHESDNVDIQRCSETRIPLPDQSIDAAVCLASLHHVQNRLGFFKEIARVLEKNARFVIADVSVGSKPAVFLNEFVNRWNKQGHNGDFLQETRETEELQSAGFDIVKRTEQYHWQFDDINQARQYLRNLFCLDLNPPDAMLDSAIVELGCRSVAGGFQLNWQLDFLSCNLLG